MARYTFPNRNPVVTGMWDTNPEYRVIPASTGEFIWTDEPIPEPTDGAIVDDGETVVVGNSAGNQTRDAVASVTDKTLEGVTLSPTVAFVDNADAVTLLPATGTTPAQGSATAAVASGAVTGFRLSANRAAITTAATAPVQNSAGASIGTGTITIAANAISHIRLPATAAGVTNNSTSSAPVTGTWTNTVRFTVAGGVITGIELS